MNLIGEWRIWQDEESGWFTAENDELDLTLSAESWDAICQSIEEAVAMLEEPEMSP